LLQFDAQGNVAWQYINTDSNGKAYRLNWSRPVSRRLGDAVRARAEAARCESGTVNR
jgi:hypothetical protein